MSILLAINGWDLRSWQERFQALLPDREVLLAASEIDASRVKYIACWKHTPGSLARYKDCQVLFSLGAGVDHLITDYDLPDAPIVRIVDPDLTGRMSEWVAWQCLDWLRQGKMYRQLQSEQRWFDDRHQPAAQDVRVGIMGLGELGMDAVERLRHLRFDVAGWSRTPKHIPHVRSYAGESELSAFLARTDILVVLLPLTSDTRGIINADLLRKLARDGRLCGPVLLNAGRGGLQVEIDILAALDTGQLKGASLDVFEQEPLVPTSALWTHKDVTITPHNSAMSHPDAIAQSIVSQIKDFEQGEPLKHVVMRDKGY
jgi:glyoxylate/hydroxypyruvate reductase